MPKIKQRFRQSIVQPELEFEPIPIDARLVDVEVASRILTEQYGRGYSVSSIRRRCATHWVQGQHYVLNGSLIKIYLPAVQKWQLQAR